NIDIYYEQQLTSEASTNSLPENSTTSAAKSQTPIDSSRDYIVEDERSTSTRTVQEPLSDHDNMVSSSGADFQNKRKRKRKKNLCSEDENLVMLDTVEKQNERST
ncbi:unnamed protein product, partial [Rotaria magnacalcarata]